VRDDFDVDGGRAPGRPSGAALVASLASRDDRYGRVARMRGDLAPVAVARVRTGVVDRLVGRLHLPLLAGPAARAAARWRVLRASGADVDWRPWWRSPLVALALLPLAVAGAVFVAVLLALVALDVVLRALPAPGRALRRSVQDREPGHRARPGSHGRYGHSRLDAST
jgi:hypothetical protein